MSDSADLTALSIRPASILDFDITKSQSIQQISKNGRKTPEFVKILIKNQRMFCKITDLCDTSSELALCMYVCFSCRIKQWEH